MQEIITTPNGNPMTRKDNTRIRDIEESTLEIGDAVYSQGLSHESYNNDEAYKLAQAAQEKLQEARDLIEDAMKIEYAEAVETARMMR